MDKGLMTAELEIEEGRVGHAYLDSLGFLTLGIGRLVDERKGGRISDAEINLLCSNDIDAKMAEMDLRLPWWRVLSEVRQRVLLNMAFQMGVDGLAKFKNTLDYIHNGRYDDAAKGMLASMWAQQTPARALRMANRMRDDHV